MTRRRLPIIHLCLDEKFINYARKVYEAAYPGSNTWFVYKPEGSVLTHVTPSAAVQVVGAKWLTSTGAQQLVNEADVVVIHFLDRAFFPLLRATRPRFAVWHSWGEDLYPLLTARSGSLYLPSTGALMAQLRRRQLFKPRQLVAKLKSGLARVSGELGTREVLQKLDRVSMTPGEYKMFEASWPGLPAQFQYFHYYSVEDSFISGPGRMSGPDILLGNSASGSNNHIEALEMLSELDLTGRRVYCPLSYGDSAYADAITRLGEQLLGECFYPIRDFLALADYYAMLERCGIVLMNHVRQQAVGTIGAALYKGASVFLRSENPALAYFQETGATLFEINQFPPTRELTEAEVLHNQACLAERYQFDRVVDCVRDYPVVAS